MTTLTDLQATKKKEFEKEWQKRMKKDGYWRREEILSFLLTSLQEAYEAGEKNGIKKASKEASTTILNTIHAFRKFKSSHK